MHKSRGDEHAVKCIIRTSDKCMTQRNAVCPYWSHHGFISRVPLHGGHRFRVEVERGGLFGGDRCDEIVQRCQI